MKQIKKKSKSLSRINPSTILSIGHYELNYSITLNDDDINKYNIKDISNLKTYEDITFIVENKYLWNQIEIETENNLMNLLLYLNKINSEANKSYIEFISYECPIYYNDSIKTMIQTVNEFHFIFVNNYSINQESKKYFKLKIKFHDKETIINFDSSDICKTEENLEEVKSSHTNYLKNETNIFNKIKLDCVSYDYFICSLKDTMEINPYDNFIEFLVYIKINFGALLAIEYEDLTDDFKDSKSMALLNKIYLITDIFLFDEKDTISNFKQHYEVFSKDINKKQIDSNKENINIQNLPQNNFKDINGKDIFDYFKHTITCNGTLSILNNKLGIFLDNKFSKISFIEVPMNIKATTISYEIKPYPKLTHSTVDLVEFYKGKLRQKRNYYKYILYGGILSKIVLSKRKNIGLEVIYTAYLTGCEILKKILYLKSNDIPIPNNQKFFQIKINNGKINDYVKNQYLNKKENRFVLDCTNLKKSKLKYYVPLFDENLQEFFGKKITQKELVNRGLIDSKGYVNYDPIYRSAMGVPKNVSQKYSSPLGEKVNKGMKPTKRKLPVIKRKLTNLSKVSKNQHTIG